MPTEPMTRRSTPRNILPWLRRVPLAWKMISHKKGRMLVSVAAIAFSVLMMFMQLGFLNGLYDGQAYIIDQMTADLVVVNKSRHQINQDDQVPIERLHQAQDEPGVQSAAPVLLESQTAMWRSLPNGKPHFIRVIGINPRRPIFRQADINDQLPKLDYPNTILFDAESRPFFGALADGAGGELSSRRMTIVGTFQLGADFRNDGNAIVSADEFRRLFPHQTPQRVGLVLLTLAPNADPKLVQTRLQERLPRDVDVLTLEEYSRLEKRYWQKMSPVGFIFGLGLFVGFVIGMMICYQILYNDVTDHLPQFATLRAIGYSNRYLFMTVMTEAVILAVLGLAPALLLSQGFYSAMRSVTGIRMMLTPGRVVLVCSLTLVFCMLSGLLAVTRAVKADPAEVFA